MGWIKYGFPFYEWDKKSFYTDGLNKAGTLIETEEGEFLIGHINREAGICDDCLEFPNGTIIKRYKIVWCK